MSNQKQQTKPDGGASVSTAMLGAAVIVDGVVVAWFADFTETSREWCTENHFGKWLTWRAKPPEMVPLTEAEYDEAMRAGRELAKHFEGMQIAVEIAATDNHSDAERRSPDLHTQGIYAVLDAQGVPVPGTLATTGYSALSQLVREKNIFWSKAVEQGYRVVELGPK